MNELGLAEAISQLRREITQAMQAAEGEPLQFLLGPVEIELQVKLSAVVGAKAELKWVVVSVGGEAKGERTSSHKVKLTLTPQHEGRADVKVKDHSSRPG